MELSAVRADLALQGFAWLRGAMSLEQCQALKAEFGEFAVAAGRGGVRQIHQKSPPIAALALQGAIAQWAQQLLGASAQLVRTILFDKTQQQNWLVAWHQDLTVTAAQRFADDAWGPWSQKENQLHVQAPLAVLQSMLTMRLHLDPANLANGALKVIPASHQAGIVRTEFDIAGREVVVCEAEVGDILLMSPLLWHSSAKASEPSGRALLHFEYANHACGRNLGWHSVEVNA